MIWAIVSKDEMESTTTSPVFSYYHEVLGKNNVCLAVVNEEDQLDFLEPGDIALLRTGSKTLSETIANKNVLSTAERPDVYLLAADKQKLSEWLSERGMAVPRQFSINDVVDGQTYFVKPRFGCDSVGIAPKSICKSKEEVERRVRWLKEELNLEAVIEQFIEGIDLTIGCCASESTSEAPLVVAPIMVECEEVDGIQTKECKFGTKGFCSPLSGKEKEDVESQAKCIFNLLEIKHHARFDFRLGRDGVAYLIDVNLVPGLGPTGLFAKSFLLCHNRSYKDTIDMVINSATK